MLFLFFFLKTNSITLCLTVIEGIIKHWFFWTKITSLKSKINNNYSKIRFIGKRVGKFIFLEVQLTSLSHRKRKRIIRILLPCSRRYNDISSVEKKSKKSSYFAPIMSNRVNEDRRRAPSAGMCPPAERPLCGFVDDLDRGGSINQWSRRATAESPWLRRLLFYHLFVSRKFQANSAGCVLIRESLA